MDRKAKALLVGAVFGAMVGGVFAWLASGTENEEGESGIEALGPSDYLQLGIGLLTLARQFGSMVKRV
jgi:hypothetical protein